MPGNPLTDPNWAPDLADQITDAIGKVRDQTTNKAIIAARAVVFGLLGGILGITIVALLLICLTRAIQALLDVVVSWEQAVYISYFLVGGILSLIGVFLMSRRHTA